MLARADRNRDFGYDSRELRHFILLKGYDNIVPGLQGIVIDPSEIANAPNKDGIFKLVDNSKRHPGLEPGQSYSVWVPVERVSIGY